jgi:hypothetical protein
LSRLVATTIAFVEAGAFLATLTKIAKDEAGCREKLPGESKLPDCNEKVYGLKPSSLCPPLLQSWVSWLLFPCPWQALLLTTLLTDEAWVDSWRAYLLVALSYHFRVAPEVGYVISCNLVPLAEI